MRKKKKHQRTPAWWEEKDGELLGDPSKSHSCLQPRQWKINKCIVNPVGAPCEDSGRALPPQPMACPSWCLAALVLGKCFYPASFLPQSNRGHWCQKHRHNPGEKHCEQEGNGAVIMLCPYGPRWGTEGSSGKRWKNKVRNWQLSPLVCLTFWAFVGLSMCVAGWVVFSSPIWV